jgi:hypothetical protein
MSTRAKIVWLDDNPGRESTATDLGAHFINVKGKDLAPEVRGLLDRSSPQLVIIDHVLDKGAADTHPLFLRGSTIAEAIKEKWPACAVVGVTNVDNLTGIDLRTKGTYDALFPFHNFAKYFTRLSGIARGFRLVARTDPEPQKLIRLLKSPNDEIERLRDSLTDDLKAPSQDASVASRMYRWVERLMDRPGFLFDSLWSATLLGLNEAGFDKVKRKFESARYTGVFARPDEHRWWSGGLSDRLYELRPPKPSELSWHVGRRLPGIKKEDFSSCYYCKEEFPETVAFLDEASSERRAMHLKCTATHPFHKRELYFEDIRIMRGK